MTRLVRHVFRSIFDVVQLLNFGQDPRGMRMRPSLDQGLKLATGMGPATDPDELIVRGGRDQFITDVGV